jgi:hypothetical protein
MAWIAKLTAKAKVSGKGQVTVEYSTTGANITETLTVDFKNCNLVWLKQTVKARLDQLDAIEAFMDGLTVNPAVQFDATPTPPTQAELDLAAFRNDCIFVRRADKGIRAGIFTGSENIVTSAKTRIHDNMVAHVSDPEYQATLDQLP